MFAQCDTSIGDRYTSQTQKSRVISEAWFLSNGYCLSCDCDQLVPTAINTKASDFFCPNCEHNYELKTFKNRPKRSLVDGSYNAMMGRITNGTAPTLVLLERNNDWNVQNVIALHNIFLTPNVIVQRKPLALTARRAGWVGCNIRLDLISRDAQVAVIEHGRSIDPNLVRFGFQRFNRLRSLGLPARGWATLTLRVVRSLGVQRFSLDNLYRREQMFSAEFPMNLNVRAKIRQQLQVLRDLRYLEFAGRGEYRLLI